MPFSEFFSGFFSEFLTISSRMGDHVDGLKFAGGESGGLVVNKREPAINDTPRLLLTIPGETTSRTH